MKGVSAWATVIVGISIGICSSGVIRGSMPSIAVTSGIRVAVVCALENGQIQSVHIVATRTRLVVIVGVCSRSRIACAVPIVVLASCNMIGQVAAIADGKMQGVRAGATVIVNVSISVSSCGGV